MDKLIEEIITKLESEGQNPKTHFEGMLHSKPMNYWDYIQTEPLLNLQTQRTNLPDELIFIMYGKNKRIPKHMTDYGDKA